MRILPLLFSDAHKLFIKNTRNTSAKRFLRQIFVVRVIVTAVFFIFKSINLLGVSLLSLPATIIVLGVKTFIKSVENINLLISIPRQQEKHLMQSIVFIILSYVCFESYKRLILSDPKNGIAGGQPGVLEYFFLNSLKAKDLKELRIDQLFIDLY